MSRFPTAIARAGVACETGSRAVTRSGHAVTLAALLLLAAPIAPRAGGAAAQTITQEEALRLAFPEPATVERRTAFLGRSRLERARELAGPEVSVESSIVTYYVGRREGRVTGVAYFDAHPVRTLQEVVMVVVTPGGTVEDIEVLKFSEPPEYRPPGDWLDQFTGLALGERLSGKGEIVNITGATLTADAVTGAVRRVLALHRVIRPLAEGPPER